MDSLDKYKNLFDESYPKYADSQYGEIKRLVEIYDAPDTLDLLKNEEFRKFLALVKPVIAIKNYKSQIPFPEDLVTVVQCVIAIRSTKAKSGDILEAHKTHFENLLSLQGFQLPTVSAIFHFCHPDSFPIVDVNVAAACTFLKTRFPEDFKDIKAPILPAANTSSSKKAETYVAFIAFIDRVRSLQAQHDGQSDYRDIDKALMVLGALRIRKTVDADDSL